VEELAEKTGMNENTIKVSCSRAAETGQGGAAGWIALTGLVAG